jgi:hypothetical protein
MYLVELKPGKEELYRTGDELAIAIRDGDVDARSRIYHRATAKWISITLHPQYKAIVAGQDEPARPARKAWGLLPTALGGVPVELTSTEAPAAEEGVRQRWKRPLGLGLAGIMLLLGIQLAFSGPRPPWAGQGKPVSIGSQTREQPALATRDEPVAEFLGDYDPVEMASLASTGAAWPAPSLLKSRDSVAAPLPLDDGVPALPRAPRLRPKALRAALASDVSPKRAVKANSVQALLGRYEAASEEARGQLESGIRVARLHRLFAPARLAPGGGVTDTRLSLAGASNFIRVYRQQQDAIHRAYQDSVTLLAKRHHWSQKQMKQWSSRPGLKENPTLELLSRSLLSGIDSILGVLDAHAGAYKVRGTAIAFEDPAATQAYGSLRRQIKEQIEAAVAAGGATELGPTGLLLQAIGTTTLPRET